jgi:hypothetical protein
LLPLRWAHFIDGRRAWDFYVTRVQHAIMKWD